jgi:hypothetical protein
MINQCCVSQVDHSKVKLGDPNSTTAIFLNDKRETFTTIRIDGCVIKNARACDWVLEKSDSGRIAIELKGCDVDHAATQIEATFAYFRAAGLNDLKFAGLIICTKYPRHDTKVARIQQRLAKLYAAPLRVKTDGRNLSFEVLLNF